MSDKKTVSNLLEDFPELKLIPADKYPNHIFIIPDGNRRYAKKHKKPTFWGHKKGFETAIRIIRKLRSTPVKVIGLWGFSSDNWKRNEKEVKALMLIFEFLIDTYLQEFIDNNCRFVHIGRKDRLPKKLLKKIENAEKITQENDGQILCLALDFGGEDQLIRMFEQAARIKPKTIDSDFINNLKDSGGLIPSADLIIRTSETRTSDVGWINGRHSVLYFIPDKLFPEVSDIDVKDSIEYFYNTGRREGA